MGPESWYPPTSWRRSAVAGAVSGATVAVLAAIAFSLGQSRLYPVLSLLAGLAVAVPVGALFRFGAVSHLAIVALALLDWWVRFRPGHPNYDWALNGVSPYPAAIDAAYLLLLVPVELRARALLGRRTGWDRRVVAAAVVVGLALVFVALPNLWFFAAYVDDGCTGLGSPVHASQSAGSLEDVNGDRRQAKTVTLRFCRVEQPVMVLVDRPGEEKRSVAVGVGDGGRIRPQWSSGVDAQGGEGRIEPPAVVAPGDTMTVGLALENGTVLGTRYLSDIEEHDDEFDCRLAFDGSTPNASVEATSDPEEGSRLAGDRPCAEFFGSGRPLRSGDRIEVYRLKCSSECTWAIRGDRIYSYEVE